MTDDPQKFSLALVTGASSGIGYALCKLLASQGINLIISGRNLDNLKKLESELKGVVKVNVVVADLSKDEGRKILSDKIREEAPDLIINNAGYGFYGDALSSSTEEQLDIIRVDVEAVVGLSLDAARTLVSREKKGVILNVSSVAAFFVFPSFAVYSASKAFINSFSQALDVEMETQGIRVLAACPGMVDTNFRKRAGEGRVNSDGSAEIKDSKGVMTSEFAAKEIWSQIEKLKPIHAFDWRYRIGIVIERFLPTRWLTRILRSNILERTKRK